MVNSGTSALITALLAHGIGPGDEVIITTFTFIASVNAILSVGAKPVLVDSDLETFNTTPEIMKNVITEKTKAIIPVDVGGMSIDINAFTEFARKNNLIFIQDSAESIGAEYGGKKVGSFDHTSVFSFHMAKLATTVEGGCVLTNDDEIAEKCRMIRNHGMQGKYDYKCFGLNFRITDIQAAIGRIQLRKLNGYIRLRNKLADIYKKGLGDKIEYQKVPDYVNVHPYMLFGILTDVEKRDSIIKLLNENGVGTRICWLPTHKQDYHRKIFEGNYPNSELLASRIINLPMGNGLTEKDVNYVVKVFNKILEK